MLIKNLSGQQAALARTWVPFLCGIYRGGAIYPGTSSIATLTRNVLPIKFVDGKTLIVLDELTVQPGISFLDTFMGTGTVTLDDVVLQFPSRLPEIHDIPGGLKLTWAKQPFVDQFLARLIGVKIESVLLYPDRAEIMIDNHEDAIITWE